MDSSLTITTASQEASSEIADLLIAQELRHYTHDGRLRAPRTREQIEAEITRVQATTEKMFVVRDAQQHVRGYVVPAILELEEDDTLRAFVPARSSVIHTLVLPDPADADAKEVASALLSTLSAYWAEQGTAAALVRWPSYDTWLQPLLREWGLVPDSVCATRPVEARDLSGQHRAEAWSIRQARQADEAMLMQLYQEELQYHERHVAYIDRSNTVLNAFHEKMAHVWAGETIEEGAPLILVAEQDGEIVAMAENVVFSIDETELVQGFEPGFTAPGRYWCIDNVSVREQVQGRGLGLQLTLHIFNASAVCADLNGFILFYSLENPSAARFWPRMGFTPLWTTYQRLF